MNLRSSDKKVLEKLPNLGTKPHHFAIN